MVGIISRALMVFCLFLSPDRLGWFLSLFLSFSFLSIFSSYSIFVFTISTFLFPVHCRVGRSESPFRHTPGPHSPSSLGHRQPGTTTLEESTEVWTNLMQIGRLGQVCNRIYLISNIVYTIY